MVTMEKPNEKLERAGWEFDATGCIRRLKKNYYCEVLRGASHALKIDTSKNEMDFTPFTKDQIESFYKLKIFKSHYAKLLGDLVAALKPYLIVTIIVIIAAIALGAYNAYATNEMSKSIAEILRASSAVIIK